MVYAYLLFTTAAWGSLYIASKIVLETTPPVTLLLFRYIVASAALAVILRFRKRCSIARGDWKYIFFIGFAAYFVAIGAQMVGTKLANASVTALINAMNPVFIIVFAVPVLGEKVTLTKAAALISSVCGAAVIMGGAGADGELAGILFSLLSVLLWSFVSVVIRKVTRKYDPVVVTAYAIFIAALCTIPASAVELSVVPHGEILSARNALLFVYMGIVCTALPHLFWNKALSMIEAGRCALFYPVQPLTAALLGAVFLKEELGWRFAAGSILIISSVVVAVVFPGTKDNPQTSE